MAKWWIYIVRCRDGSLYTGIATDVRRRIAEHAGAGGRGAKYLRGKGPLRLVLSRRLGARGLALRVEHRIKRLRKAQKEALLLRPSQVDRLLEPAPRPPTSPGPAATVRRPRAPSPRAKLRSGAFRRR